MADDASKKPNGACAQCLRSTTNRCTGCLDAPVYDAGVSHPTFYCSPVCQKADWSLHKSECRKLQARKTLCRATVILRAIIYKIRLHASALQFKSMRIEGSNIFLEGFHIDMSNTRRQLKPFPVCLGSDRRLFEAALVFSSCMEAMMFLHSFVTELLVGKSTVKSQFSSAILTCRCKQAFALKSKMSMSA